jgi:hypothetical protein
MPREYRGKKVIDPLIVNVDAKRRWMVNAAPRPLYPLEEPWVPFNRRLRDPQVCSGEEKNPFAPGFEPWTVQPVASRCIDCAILHFVAHCQESLGSPALAS